MLGFATRTWNDWDYLPQAFPRWLDAPEGVLLVGTPGAPRDGGPALDADGQALDSERAVAVVRVTLVAPGEAWLEAIRVDPRVRGMDIATDLQVAELHWAAAQAAHVVRYATSARNEASHRLGARGGFELLTSLRSHWWSETGDPEDGGHPPSGFLPEVETAAEKQRAVLLKRLASDGRIAGVKDGPVVWQRLEGDEAFVGAARLYEPRPWALEELTADKFERHLLRSEVIIASRNSGWAMGIITRRQLPAEDATPRLAVLAGEGPAALELVEASRQAASTSVRFRVPSGAQLVSGHAAAFSAAGYVSPEWTLHVLARPLDADQPPPDIDPTRLTLADQPRAALVSND